MSSDCCAVYELPQVQRITGNTIRPGGLALTKRALAMAALPAASTVLDVGCGTGATVAYLSRLGLRAVGLDASAALLGQAEASGGLSQGRAEHLPFPAGRFDGLFAECCLSLMDDAALALAEFARVLRPDGTLVVGDMLAGNAAGAALARQLPLSCCVRGAFSRPQIEALLAAAGFELLWWEDHSEALKQLTVQIIWEYGSLASFWRCAAGDDPLVATAMSGLRPGYFVLLARRV